MKDAELRVDGSTSHDREGKRSFHTLAAEVSVMFDARDLANSP